jgi:hypothetical protein
MKRHATVMAATASLQLAGQARGLRIHKNMKYTSIFFSTLALATALLLAGCSKPEASPQKLVTNGPRWVQVPFVEAAPAPTNILWQMSVIFSNQRISVVGFKSSGTNGIVAIGRLPSVHGVKPSLYAANLRVTVNDGEISMFEIDTNYPEKIDGR